MYIEFSRMRVLQLGFDYFELIENIGYKILKEYNPNITVTHIKDELYPMPLRIIVTKDLEYRQV